MPGWQSRHEAGGDVSSTIAQPRSTGRNRGRWVLGRLFPDGIRPLRTARLAPVPRATAIAGLVAIAGLAVLVLTGWRGPEATTPVLGNSYWPLILPVTIVSAGLVVALLAMAAATSSTPRRLALGAVCSLLALWSLDSLPQWPFRLALVLLGVGMVMIAFIPSRRLTYLVRLLLAALPFAAAAAASVSKGGIQADIAALRAMQLGTVTALVIAAIGAFGLVSALQARHERTAHLIEGRASIVVLVLVLTAKLALLASLYSRVTGDWLGGEPYWRPRLNQPLSWLHACVVAALILWVVTRSWRRPLVARGFRTGAAVVAAGSSLGYLLGAVVGVLASATTALNPAADTSGLFAAASTMVDALGNLQLVLALGVLVSAAVWTVRRRPWSTGWYVWLLAGVWLVPPLVGIALPEQPITFWATPGQVDTAITLGTTGYAILAAARGELRGRATLMVRLLVIPFLVINGAQLFPASWTEGLVALGVVASAVVSLGLDAPRVSADPRTHQRASMALVATQLALITTVVYLAPDAALSGQLDTAAASAWLWLALPVAGVLAARARPALDVEPAPAITN
jgi:hypothetical protein